MRSLKNYLKSIEHFEDEIDSDEVESNINMKTDLTSWEIALIRNRLRMGMTLEQAILGEKWTGIDGKFIVTHIGQLSSVDFNAIN